MRVLVVGAGAVGQVYGYHLHKGGAQVCFFLKDKYVERARRGFVLYPLHAEDPLVPRRFTDFSICTTAAEVAAQKWDVLRLTVASPALLGPWIGELVRAVGDQATLAMLQPGRADLDVVTQHVDRARVLSGLITIISYPAPLPGETRFPEPGMAYWFPPLAPGPFSGDRARVDALVKVLDRGDQPVKRAADVPGDVEVPTALLMPWLAALELGGWTFAGLADPRVGALGSQAAHETLTIVRKQSKRRAWLATIFTRAWFIRFVLWLGARLVPLPLEIYLREHFTKVGSQTRQALQRFVALAPQLGVAAPALTQLIEQLPSTSAAP